MKSVHFAEHQVNFINVKTNKHLANAKRLCDCSVVCLRPKSCTVQLSALYFGHDVTRQRAPYAR